MSSHDELKSQGPFFIVKIAAGLEFLQYLFGTACTFGQFPTLFLFSICQSEQQRNEDPVRCGLNKLNTEYFWTFNNVHGEETREMSSNTVKVSPLTRIFFWIAIH